MLEGTVMMLARDFLQIGLTVATPILVVSVAVGLFVSITQVLTSVQDATLAYVLRLGAVVLVLALVGRWMLHGIAAYTIRLWHDIPGIVG